MADETRTCTGCQETKPLASFAKDVRRKSGVRAKCKRCDAQAVSDRRRGSKPQPGGLVLVPNPPAWGEPPADTRREADLSPADPAWPMIAATVGGRAPLGDYSAAAERFIAALVPPAGDADALLVRSLRGLAELLDVAEHGASEWVVRDTTALVAKLIAVQRELAATRASKAGAQPAAGPAVRDVSQYA